MNAAGKSRMLQICFEVAEAYDLTVRDLLSPRRYEPLATARHLAIYLMRLEGHCATSIEDYLNRKASLVCYARQAIQDRLPLEPALRAQFEKLCHTLKINPGDSGV